MTSSNFNAFSERSSRIHHPRSISESVNNVNKTFSSADRTALNSDLDSSNILPTALGTSQNFFSSNKMLNCIQPLNGGSKLVVKSLLDT